MIFDGEFMNYFAPMKPLPLFISVSALCIILISFFLYQSKNDQAEKHKVLVLRNIGHQILLHAKDSSSTVLPIQKLDDHTYQISFQHSFAFIPDSLISLVQLELKKSDFPQNYYVSVIDCQQQSTIYAFEINAKSGNLTPCTGRKQGSGCYLIQISFDNASQIQLFIWIGLVCLLIIMGNFFRKKILVSQNKTESLENVEARKIGQFSFYPSKQKLQIEDRLIPLSEKETKSLLIFIDHINQVIEREKLIKEIWEEEGIVVISRNVDVLVSKLRKKLSDDPSIKFINIHNKGYKLVIE